MATITQFDKPTCRRISSELQAAMQAVADSYGLVVAYKGGRYSDSNYTPKFELAVKSTDGTVKTREAEDFKRLAFVYGFKPDDLYRTFNVNGDQYKLVGMKPKSHKYPMIGEKLGTNKRFKFTQKTVSMGMGFVK